MPFVRDRDYPHKWDNPSGLEQHEIVKFKRWQRFLECERTGEKMGAAEKDDKSNPDRLKLKLQTLDFRIKGEYMQPFQPFYGPKERLDPMPAQERKEKEKILLDEVESAIK